MKIVTYPPLDWREKAFRCPGCGVEVQFEVDDLKGISQIKPRLESGVWRVTAQCPLCRKVQVFHEVQESGGKA